MKPWPILAGTRIVLTSTDFATPVGTILTVQSCDDGQEIALNDGTGRKHETGRVVFTFGRDCTGLALGFDDFAMMPDGEP